MADAEVTDERIYSDLKAYADAGMLEYVLPTDPIGEQWIVGWKGQILKFVTQEGIVGFLTGIQVAVLFAASLRQAGDHERGPDCPNAPDVCLVCPAEAGAAMTPAEELRALPRRGGAVIQGLSWRTRDSPR